MYHDNSRIKWKTIASILNAVGNGNKISSNVLVFWINV